MRIVRSASPRCMCLGQPWLAVVAGLLLSACAARTASWRAWSPPLGDCVEADWEEQVQATADGGFDDVLPVALADAESPVRLHGVARRLKVESHACRVRAEALPGQWSLTYFPPGGAPQDMSRLLTRANARDPSFTPSQAGTYRADWRSGQRIEQVWIDVIARHIANLPTYTRRWVALGPDGSTDALGHGTLATGKIEALAFDPRSDLTLYAGSSLGGIWRSDDAGGHWVAVTDNKGLEGMSIGALTVASDGAIYAGGLVWARCANGAGCRSLPGIWKSENGGATWRRTGTTTPGCPPGSVTVTGQQTKRIIRHPWKADWLYAATDQGLLRTLSGGDCWEKIADPFFDLAATPFDPGTLYMVAPNYVSVPGVAGMGQGFKATNAWDPSPTFQRLPFPAVVPAPGKEYTFSEATVAMGPLPSTVYVALASRKQVVFLRTADGGTTWRYDPGPNALACGGQCDYDLAIAVAPADPTRLIFGEVGMWEGVWGTGGVTWTSLNGVGKHADVHAVAFASNPRRVVIATDGGVYGGTLAPKAGDPMSAWTALNGGLATTIGFDISIAPTNADATAIGQWDNNRVRRFSGRVWEPLIFNEGYNVAFDASSDAILYGTGHGVLDETIKRHPDGARAFGPVVPGYPGPVGRCSRSSAPCKTNADCPFQVVVQSCVKDSPALTVTTNPLRANEVLGQFREGPGPRELYVIRGVGDAWRCAQPWPDGVASVVSVDFPDDASYVVSRSQGRDVVRFSLAPLGSQQQLCSDGTDAIAVESVYKPVSVASNVRIAVDPFDPASVYVVDQTPGATLAYSATRKGTSWERRLLGDASGALAGAEVFGIAPDPDPLAAGVLWLGTNKGLFEGTPQGDGTYAWARNRSVPDVQVSSLAAQRARQADGSAAYDGTLRLSTAGRGVWEGMIRPRRRPVSVYCASCPAALAERVESRQRETWIAARIDDRPAGGAYVRVRPTRDGTDTGYFLSEMRGVPPDGDTSTHLIRYAAAGAPPALRTDGLELALLAGDRQTVLARHVVPFERLWVREGWDLLTVEAVRLGRGSPDQVPLAVPLTFRPAGVEPQSVTAPRQVAAPSGGLVTVAAPRSVGTDPTLYLRGWAVDGVPAPSTGTTFTTASHPNARITALYERGPATAPPPRCGAATPPQCGGTCPPGMTCASRRGCRCMALAGPDIIVTALSPANAGGDCAVAVTIQNVGDARAGASTLSVQGIAGIEPIRTELSIDALAVGETRRQVATLSGIPCSPLNVVATADARGDVTEREEGNNSLRQQFP